MPKSFHKRNSFTLSKHYNKSLNEDFGTFEVWASGYQAHNQLGREGQQGDTSSPVQTFPRMNRQWVFFSSDQYTQAGIRADGTLWTWGHDTYGKLGQRGQVQRRTSPTLVFPEYNWTDVAQGNDHDATSICAAAVRSDGTLWTWGTNSHGSLGVNHASSFEKYSSPVQVGIDTNWSFVYNSESYGNEYSGAFQYAGKTDGTLWAWGFNNHGQLGDNTTNQRNSPVQVLGTGWTNKIARVYYGFLGIKTDNTLWSCGWNGHGGLGQNDMTPRSSPIQIPGTNWSKVAASHHILALKSDNTLWSWGYNAHGQIGDLTTIDKSSPIQIPGTWTDVAAGTQCSYGIKTGGTLWSWGHNNYGNLGTNNQLNYSSPIQIGVETTWTNVWGTWGYFWARKSDGSIWGAGRNTGRCLGSTNVSPPGSIQPPNRAYEENMFYSSPVQVMAAGGANTWNKISLVPDRAYLINSSNRLFGVGFDEQWRVVDFGNKDSPIQVPGRWKYVNVTTNIVHAIRSDGTLWKWGYGGWGQGGNNYNIDNDSPIQIGSDNNWEMVTSNYHGVYAKRTNGTLWSWGHNNGGMLGNNTTISYSSPVQVTAATDWKTVSTCYGSDGWQGREGTNYHVLATKNDGSLWGWGHNDHGEVRADWARKNSSPIQILGNTSWRSVAANYIGNLYAIRNDGTFWSLAGRNDHGQIGDSTVIPRSSPVQVPGTNWEQVQAGGHHVLALRTDDTLWGWGHNNHGQLGIATAISTNSSPVQIPGSWRNFHTNRDHTTAVRPDNTMLCWGLNDHGQLGIAITTYSSPIQIGTAQWRQSSAGYKHTAAVRTDGTLWAWGLNDQGQLGTNNVTNVSSPVQIGTLNTWSTTHCGYRQTFAIRTDGTLWAWGLNTNGQLGVNTPVLRYSSPVQIPGNTWTSVCAKESFEIDDDNKGDFGSIMVFASKSDGTLWTWGKYYNLQSGQTINTAYSSPVQIPGVWRGVTDNSGNYNNTDFASRQPFTPSRFSGLMADGTVNNYLYRTGVHLEDQFLINAPGVPTIGNHVSSPIQIMDSGNWLQAHAGKNRHSVAVRNDGTIWVWGLNSHGQVGTGDRMSRSSPTQVPGTGWIYASSGTYGSWVGIRSDGTWWGCGYDGHGQNGWGRNITTSSPVQAPGSNFTMYSYAPTDRWNTRLNGQHNMYALKERR